MAVDVLVGIALLRRQDRTVGGTFTGNVAESWHGIFRIFIALGFTLRRRRLGLGPMMNVVHHFAKDLAIVANAPETVTLGNITAVVVGVNVVGLIPVIPAHSRATVNTTGASMVPALVFVEYAGDRIGEDGFYSRGVSWY